MPRLLKSPRLNILTFFFCQHQKRLNTHFCFRHKRRGQKKIVTNRQPRPGQEGKAQPPTVVRKVEARSEHVPVAYTFFFARFGADSYAQSVLSDESFCIGTQ